MKTSCAGPVSEPWSLAPLSTLSCVTTSGSSPGAPQPPRASRSSSTRPGTAGREVAARGVPGRGMTSMTGRTFLDSNVLVYSVDESPPKKAKHDRAIEVLSTQPDSLVVSTQVLQEFYVVTTRKLKPPLSAERAARAVRGIAKL